MSERPAFPWTAFAMAAAIAPTLAWRGVQEGGLGGGILVSMAMVIALVWGGAAGMGLLLRRIYGPRR